MVGLTHDAVHARVRAGRLHRVHRGVYAVGHHGLTDHGRWKAATLALGPRAVLSHRSAAELWELLPPTGRRVRTSPSPTQPRPRQRAKIRIHRSRTLAPHAHHEPRQHPGDHARPDARRPRPHLRQTPKFVVPRARPRSAGSRSTRVRLGQDRERPRARLPRDLPPPPASRSPRSNVSIGRHRVDFLWRDERLIVEVDGYIYHRGRRAMRDDNDRDLELELRRLQGRPDRGFANRRRPRGRRRGDARTSRGRAHKIDACRRRPRTARGRRCS